MRLEVDRESGMPMGFPEGHQLPIPFRWTSRVLHPLQVSALPSNPMNLCNLCLYWD